MTLKPIVIKSDEKRREPPPERERTLGEAFDDVVSSLSEKFRLEASKLAGTVLNDLHDLKPTLSPEAQALQKALSDRLHDMRVDMINGGWKGVMAASDFMKDFSGYHGAKTAHKNEALIRFRQRHLKFQQ